MEREVIRGINRFVLVMLSFKCLMGELRRDVRY